RRFGMGSSVARPVGVADQPRRGAPRAKKGGRETHAQRLTIPPGALLYLRYRSRYCRRDCSALSQSSKVSTLKTKNDGVASVVCGEGGSLLLDPNARNLETTFP